MKMHYCYKITHRQLLFLLLATFVMASPLYAAENLLTNPGFEQGISGWTGRNCTLSTSTVRRGGRFSGYATNRTATWQGIKQSMLDKMVPGETYTIAAWIRLENTASDSIIATFEQRDDRGVTYIRVKASTGYSNQWIQLSGHFTLNVVGTLTALFVYFEGPAPGVNFYLDDVEVVGEKPPDVSGASATAPHPENKSIPEDANSAMPLSWSPGDSAVLHDVYLDTDRAAVENADTLDTTGVYRGSQDVNSYMPSEVFEFDTTYYWRVDEVQVNLATTYKGSIWSFTIGPEPPHLKDLAAYHQIWIGSEVSSGRLVERPYQDTLKREFNLLTPGNDMKWGPIHPQRNQYNFSPADAIVDFAESNGMDVHGHTLVWHNQNPDWLTDGNFTSIEMIDILRDHIHTVVSRYAGRIAVWDVVNEVVTSSGLRETLWMNRIGPEYIDMAFQFASEADPNAILIINDYSIEPVNSKSTILYNLVRDLQGRGVPIHGVGFQMHLVQKWALDYQSFANNMRRFAELGLQIYITEMDVRIQEPVTDADLTRQATIYGNVLARCLEESACMGFQTWGFTDKYSWIPGHFEGYNDALIFDRSYLPKPAYYSLREELFLNIPPDPTLPYVEAFETGDFSSFGWESFGDTDWTVTSDEHKSGTYSAQAGSIDDNRSTTLKLTLDCVSGEISFYYKVSSEQHYDYLRFYIDGTQQDEWSGDEDWTQISYLVRSGRRTFEWVYLKDESSSDGSDTAWIDDIVFPID